jgi:hypothetical protein
MSRKHEYQLLELETLRNLIAGYQFPHAAVKQQDAIISMINHALDTYTGEAHPTACVIKMRPGDLGDRGVFPETSKIKNIFGGGDHLLPNGQKRVGHYPGDQQIRSGGESGPAIEPNLITLQIHRPALTKETESGKEIICQVYPSIQVWIPSIYQKSYRVE